MSGLGIPDILMNIISYNGFFKYLISTVILPFCSDLVPYYLSLVFGVFETEEGAIDNIPMSVKSQIHADNLHQEENILTCKA